MKEKHVNDFGTIVFRELGILDQVYKSVPLSEITTDSEIEINLYNKYIDKFAVKGDHLTQYIEPDMSVEEFHAERQKWNIPKEYLEIDLEEYFAHKISTSNELERVKLELQLYEKHNILDILKLMIFLVDHFRTNDIIYGVGRGSSVSSYLLFLIGIHRVDSLKYDLCVSEFLK